MGVDLNAIDHSVGWSEVDVRRRMDLPSCHETSPSHLPLAYHLAPPATSPALTLRASAGPWD